MKRAFAIVAALGTLLCLAADKRKPQQKKEESHRVEMADVVVHRDEKLITVDGRVRNSGEKPIRKLMLLLSFVSPDGVTVTTQRGTIDDPELEPGKDSEFRWQMRDHPRAVEVNFAARDNDDREITVDRAGPYPIE